MSRRVIILGSTGSIGVQALEVMARSPELSVVGLSCASQVGPLLEQAMAYGVDDVAVADSAAAESISALYPELGVRTGAGAAARLVREVEADLVLNAIVGFAGLEATLATLERGLPLALANKESLVSGGGLVAEIRRQNPVPILPVDSEHSALFQLLEGEERRAVRSLVLTASGGPFRGRSLDQLEDISPEEALAHPTWNMGAKITIDSATLMNKGLEVIEAHHLFGVDYDDIEVLIHPGSLVHSLVRLVDGALLAHLGHPDMRVPISHALHYPRRAEVAVPQLDLAEVGRLDFSRPDEEAFPALRLAREAGKAGEGATCVLNAANEVAVHAFLERRLPFLGIVRVVEEVLHQADKSPPQTYEQAVDLDLSARRLAENAVSRNGW